MFKTSQLEIRDKQIIDIVRNIVDKKILKSYNVLIFKYILFIKMYFEKNGASHTSF